MGRVLTLSLILSVTILLGGCDSDPSTASGVAPLEQIPYFQEAQEMTLFYSGEFYPRENMTREISDELSRLRSQWGKKVPCVITTDFKPPWFSHSLGIAFDNTTEGKVLGGTYEPWNNLVAQFELVVSTFKPLERTYFYVTPTRVIHPMRLAERIREMGIEGMTWVWAQERPHPYLGNIARRVEQGKAKYFIYWPLCPDIFDAYEYFEITRTRVRHLASYKMCLGNDPDFWSLPYRDQIRILDSLESNRPAWVDTARSEFGKIEMGLLPSPTE